MNVEVGWEATGGEATERVLGGRREWARGAAPSGPELAKAQTRASTLGGVKLGDGPQSAELEGTPLR